MTAESVKIDLSYPSGIHGFMMSRGAPRYLLKSSFDITSRDLSMAKTSTYKAVTPTTQLSFLRRSIKNPTHGSWWMVIGSDVEDKTAASCALAVMQSATIKSLREPHLCAKPLFWNLYGGRWDKLRDDENYRSNHGRIGMLILSNLTANATPEKIEKAVDLLHMFSSVPRVLIVSGADPLDFAVTRLYKKPSRVLYIRRRGRIAQI